MNRASSSHWKQVVRHENSNDEPHFQIQTATTLDPYFLPIKFEADLIMLTGIENHRGNCAMEIADYLEFPLFNKAVL